MTHRRTVVRAAIAAAVSGNPGVTVEESRTYPTDETLLPRYLVWTPDEDVDRAMSTPDGLTRNMRVVVEAVAKDASATIATTLDGHCEFIETALNDSDLGGVVLNCELVRTSLDQSDQGDKPLGIATLTYNVLYRTLVSNPATGA